MELKRREDLYPPHSLHRTHPRPCEYPHYRIIEVPHPRFLVITSVQITGDGVICMTPTPATSYHILHALLGAAGAGLDAGESRASDRRIVQRGPLPP
eukprot:756611-Hanusia_phi.AAC.4